MRVHFKSQPCNDQPAKYTNLHGKNDRKHMLNNTFFFFFFWTALRALNNCQWTFFFLAIAKFPSSSSSKLLQHSFFWARNYQRLCEHAFKKSQKAILNTRLQTDRQAERQSVLQSIDDRTFCTCCMLDEFSVLNAKPAVATTTSTLAESVSIGYLLAVW